MHKHLKLATESLALAKVNESWTTEKVKSDSDGTLMHKRIGNLKYLISKIWINAKTVAVI
jgi:hypothetical protein